MLAPMLAKMYVSNVDLFIAGPPSHLHANLWYLSTAMWVRNWRSSQNASDHVFAHKKTFSPYEVWRVYRGACYRGTFAVVDRDYSLHKTIELLCNHSWTVDLARGTYACTHTLLQAIVPFFPGRCRPRTPRSHERGGGRNPILVPLFFGCCFLFEGLQALGGGLSIYLQNFTSNTLTISSRNPLGPDIWQFVCFGWHLWISWIS